MKLVFKYAVVAALVAGTVGSADAQDRQRRQGGQPGGQGGFQAGMMGGTSVYGLVAQNEDLQKELKITDEQKTKLTEALQPIRDKQREMFGGLRDASEEQRREMFQKMQKLGEDTQKAVEGVLQPEQAKRLKQINYQNMGVMAYSNKDVQTALKITDEQKERLREIGEEYMKDRRELGGFGGGRPGGGAGAGRGPDAETQKKIAALTKETEGKVTKLLTDEQKATWKEMTGEPFDTAKLRNRPMRPRDN